MPPVARRSFLAAAAALPGLSRLSLAAQTVNIGMVPDAGATQVSIEQKAPLRDYLARRMGCAINLVIPTNYNATVEALGNASLDFAYLGALTYVKAHERYGVVPLVQRSVDKQFHSLFVTSSSSIRKLADVRGKTFAFGDINSTSGHLIPFAELKAAGINPDRDLKFRYTGSHAATLKAVESGAAEVGALDETVYKTMVAANQVEASKVRIFQTSAPFVDYVWVARKGLGSKVQSQFSAGFLALHQGKDDAVLAILRGTDFVPADDAEYLHIRDIARQLNLL